MRHNWLTQVERQYVQTLLDEAIQHVKMRDMKSCEAFVHHAVQSTMTPSMSRSLSSWTTSVSDTALSLTPIT